MRRLALAAGLCLTAVLAGCSATTTTGSNVTGSTLTIYAHQTAGDPASADVIDAERLALRQAGQQVGHYRINFRVLSSRKISDDARTAAADSTTIAYLGELEQHQSAASIGITNGVGILQVSPTDTAVELTQATPAVPGSPDRYYENLSQYGRTFARVVPNSRAEARAVLQAIRAAGASRLFVTDDQSIYGRAVAEAVRGAAGAAGISVTELSRGRRAPSPVAQVRASGAGAVFAGAQASSAPAIARLFDGIAAAVPAAKLFVPSTLDGDAFAGALGAASAAATVATAPGSVSTDLTSAGHKFTTDFAAAFGHRPDAQAIFGYGAMTALLDALRRAGNSAGSRSAVVRDFFHTSQFASVLGSLTIDPATGDRKGPAPFWLMHIRNGRFVGYESVQAQG